VSEKTVRGAIAEGRPGAAKTGGDPHDGLPRIAHENARACGDAPAQPTVKAHYDLHDRLRAVFEEFRLDRVDTGVVGVLPILRRDFIDRYRETRRGR
jgi:hypothetical protein